MKDYSAMSDGEINFAIAKITGESAPKVFEWGIGRVIPDYCNNPADAWPIIIENGISILNDTGTKSWSATSSAYWVDGSEWQFGDDVMDANPLRAAMIVFLMMKDEAVKTQGEKS